MVAVRFNASGSVDMGFGDAMTKGARGIAFDAGGNKQDEARSLAIGADDSILIAGSVRVAAQSDHAGVARLNSDGTNDLAFGNAGRAVHSLCDACTQSPLRDMALQPDGRIVLVGTVWDDAFQDIAVMRLNADGKSDPSFSGNGRILNFFVMWDGNVVASSADRGASVAFLDGDILVGGSVQQDPFNLKKRDISVTRLKAK